MPGGVVVPPSLKRIKVSAIQTPDTGPNHTTVLRQAKESIEVGQRLRGDVNDSYVRVSELVALGLATIANGEVQLAGGAAAGLVSGPPSSIPPAPGMLELTDGTTDVTAVSKITVSGATVGGTSPAATLTVTGGSPLTTKGDLYGFDTANNRVPVGSNGQVLTADSTQALGVKWAASGGGSTPVPATINDLVYWLRTDIILGTSTGALQMMLQNSTPWLLGLNLNAQGAGVKVSATQLNSLDVLAFPGTSAGRYLYPVAALAPALHKATMFVVANVTSYANTPTFIGGPAGALAFRMETTGKLGLLTDFTASIGTSTSAITGSTWFQANATYDDSTGSFAFRSAQAANGSGTNVQAVTALSDSVCYDHAAAGQDVTGSLAELIIYNRVLTNTEITSVEAYLHTKWGV